MDLRLFYFDVPIYLLDVAVTIDDHRLEVTMLLKGF